MITAELLDDWLEGTRCSVNEKQLQFLELMVDRVKAEYNLPGARCRLGRALEGSPCATCCTARRARANPTSCIM